MKEADATSPASVSPSVGHGVVSADLPLDVFLHVLSFLALAGFEVEAVDDPVVEHWIGHEQQA